MKAQLLILLCLLVPAMAFASGMRVQESMVVTGTVTVNPDGRVQGYTLQEQDKLPPVVSEIVKQTVPAWLFVPIVADGKAVVAETGMSLRIVADMTDEQHVTVRIAGAEFGCRAWRVRALIQNECPKDTTIGAGRRAPPRYPIEALKAGVGGEVFLVVQVDRNGHVTQAAARQVNLFSLTDDQTYYRKVLANASLRVVRSWQFRPPTVGSNAAKDHWVVQVPINYRIGPPGSGREQYGQWKVYVPGPVQSISWDNEDASSSSGGSADAIAGGTPFVRDARFVLKTALTSGAGQS